MSAVLEITDIRKTFGGLKAVDGLGLTIEAGEVVGLLGPNGSGKTTLMNLISGALKPTEGSIRLKGQEIAGRRPDVIARAGVARTFQLVRLLPSLPLLENVAVSAMFGPQRLSRPEAEKVARACLERIGLAGRETLPAGDLTYIDQKRLELARALAGEPKLLLLDEWLAGLNPTELQEGIALIRRLASEGTTILLVEQNANLALDVSSYGYVLETGSVLLEGPSADLKANPRVQEAYLGG